MKHTVILDYRNVDMTQAPLMRFDGPIALPTKGDLVSYGHNEAAPVTELRFIFQSDEVRIVISLDGDGQGEDPYTKPVVYSL